METSNNEKKITICGTNNRYMIKKLTTDNSIKKENKKRVDSFGWNFSDDYFQSYKQIELLKDIVLNNFITTENEAVSKIVFQQISTKISGYKQQDILKKRYDCKKFIDFNNIIVKLIECDLKCRYCKDSMTILYDVSREIKQWSVDRVDNDMGHNNDNYHLACLDCNLKRRRQTDKKFLFTKQLSIIKHGIN
jgi:hypothetical protein